METQIEKLFATIYPSRDPWARKGDSGKLLVISGSQEYSGSPIFNAMAALRTGADLVTVIGHERAMNIVASYAPDIITVALPHDLSLADVPLILERMQHATGVVIGSGLPRSHETYEAIRAIVAGATKPIVIDAEAIRAISERPDLLLGKTALLTPNAGEYESLMGKPISDNAGERSAQALEVAQKYKTSVLLKGHVDVISDGVSVTENGTGVPVMAKGGFGDTLAGIAGALLSRGVTPYDAGVLAAYVNGRAGEYASRNFGEGLLASDIFSALPVVLIEGKYDTQT